MNKDARYVRDTLAHVYLCVTKSTLYMHVGEKVSRILLFANALARSRMLFAEVRKRPRATVSRNGFIFVV